MESSLKYYKTIPGLHLFHEGIRGGSMRASVVRSISPLLSAPPEDERERERERKEGRKEERKERKKKKFKKLLRGNPS